MALLHTCWRNKMLFRSLAVSNGTASIRNTSWFGYTLSLWLLSLHIGAAAADLELLLLSLTLARCRVDLLLVIGTALPICLLEFTVVELHPGCLSAQNLFALLLRRAGLGAEGCHGSTSVRGIVPRVLLLVRHGNVHL